MTRDDEIVYCKKKLLQLYREDGITNPDKALSEVERWMGDSGMEVFDWIISQPKTEYTETLLQYLGVYKKV